MRSRTPHSGKSVSNRLIPAEAGVDDARAADDGTPGREQVAVDADVDGVVAAVKQGAKRLTAMNVVDSSQPVNWRRSTSHLRGR